MKVRVAYTVDVDDDFRLALAHHWGEHGLASRRDVRRHCELVGTTEDEDILQEWHDDPCPRCAP